MINPTGYVASCDQTGCDAFWIHDNRFRLMDIIDTAGWQRNVKLNGQRAKRGGKDYCPEHRRGSS